jgi:hypothetical protein
MSMLSMLSMSTGGAECHVDHPSASEAICGDLLDEYENCDYPVINEVTDHVIASTLHHPSLALRSLIGFNLINYV